MQAETTVHKNNGKKLQYSHICEFLKTQKTQLPYDSAISLSGVCSILSLENFYSHKYWCSNIHEGTICKSQGMET